ncbi:hypothetical protein [Limnoglobus roseus]|uniref:Phage tail tape measure protein n=1 Tax=Limnoglobus roseus TaxID=2598579 RepID=A0A5C1A9P5_9BACT|nr:hypothetical protein [Limnoglobus roseus]QEL14947.1 hypothetical protein PX52LOC_01849 [Limnoglobus roseus]
MGLSSGGGRAGGVRAGSAFVELFVRDAKLGAGLKRAEQMLRATARTMATIGAGLVGVGVGAGSALAGIFAASTTRNTQFQQLSQKLGSSTEDLSKFAYAAESVGITLEEVIDDLENWPDRLSKIADGTSDLGAVFRKLGLDAKKMLASNDTLSGLREFVVALNKKGSNPEVLKALGDATADKGQNLIKLSRLGEDGLNRLFDQAQRVGAVVTSENARQSAEVSASWHEAFSAVKYSIMSVGDALLPTAATIKLIGSATTDAAVQVRGWVNENKDLALGFGLAAGAVTAIGVGFIGVGGALAVVATAWSGFVGVFSAGAGIISTVGGLLLSPILAVPTAIAAAGAAWLAFTKQGRETAGGFAGDIAGAFGPSLENAAATWGAFVQAIGRGDIQSAFSVGTAGVKVEWARLMVFLKSNWAEFSSDFAKIWEQVVTDIGIGMVGVQRQFGLISADEMKDTIGELLKMQDEFKKRNAVDKGPENAARADLQKALDALGAAKSENVYAQFLANRDAEARKNANKPGGGAGLLSEAAAGIRSTFGADATLQTFSNGGGAMKQLVNKAAQTNNILLQILNAISKTGLRVDPESGGLEFTGGK